MDKGLTMRNTLLLRPDSIEDDDWRWLRLDDDASPQGSIHAGTLANAAAEAGGLRVTLLVPGTECLLSQVENSRAQPAEAAACCSLRTGRTAVR